MRYVAAAINKLYKHREGISGLKRVYATKLLSHFTARFEPIGATSSVTGAANGAASAAINGASAAVDAVATVASSAADKIAQGLQKVGIGSGAAAGAPAGDADEAADQSDVAEGGVHDAFAQESQQPLKQQQAW